MHFWRKFLTDPRAIALAAALAAFCAVLFSPAIFNDGDTYWHIEAGRWMIDNRAVLRIDPFSYTFAGHPWPTHEWLSEVLIAFAYVGLGWSGVALLFAAAFALTAGLLARHLGRTVGGLTLVVVTLVALCGTAPSLLARPHLLALPLVEIWTAGLLAARAQGRAPHWSQGLVMLLWANLHGGFMLGLALIIPFLAEVLSERNAVQTRGWLRFSVLAVIAAVLTPGGINGLLFPIQLMAMPALYQIDEWQPLPLNSLQPLLIGGGATLFILMTRGARVKPWRLLTVLVLTYLALAQARHAMLLAIIGPLLLAEPLAAALQEPPRNGKATTRPGFLFTFLLLLIAGARLIWPIPELDNPATPQAALAQVPEELRHSPVLNDYRFGGYLIFRDVAPFIDGRAELYGQKFLNQYMRIASGDSRTLKAALGRYHIRWTLLAPASPAATAMDHMPGWRRIYADPVAVVHVLEEKP